MNDPVDVFEQLTSALDVPLFIVTLAAGERRAGCVVGFGTQTSIDPRRFLVCLSRRNHTFGLAREVDVLAVHLVPRARRDLAELFGGETGDDVDKFARCDWRPGPRGLPILEGCPSWFAGTIVARHDLGDHEGCLLEPFEARHARGELLYLHDVSELEPGHQA